MMSSRDIGWSRAISRGSIFLPPLGNRTQTFGTACVLIGFGSVVYFQSHADPAISGNGVTTFLGLLFGCAMFLAGLAVAGDRVPAAWVRADPRVSVAATDLAPKTVGELAARSAGARNPSNQLAPRKVSQRLLAVSAALGAATFVLCGGNKFTALNVAVWCASVLTFVWASWERDRKVTPFQWAAFSLAILSPERWQTDLRKGTPSDPRQTGNWRPQDGLRVSLTALIVISLLVAGALVLTWRVAEVPREMTSDHAEKLLDVQDVLDGQYRIFFPRNTGREAMQFYLIALMTPLAGVSYLTMKVGTVLVGFFTLPFTFLFVRTVSGTGVAIIALSLEVAMRWLLQVSRVGLRFPFPPAFGAAIAYFLFKCLRDRRRNDFLLLGLVTGIAQHTYTALRLVPLGVAVSLVIAYVLDRRRPGREEQASRLLADTVLMVAASALVFMPLARYAAEEPQMFLFRGMSRLASDQVNAVPPNAVLVFTQNIVNALLFFNWRGDSVWVNTIPGVPILDTVSGGLFVLGVSWSLYSLVRHRDVRQLHVGIFLFFSMLPSIMSVAYPGENPSTVRMGAAIPIVALLMATALHAVLARLWLWVGVGPPNPTRLAVPPVTIGSLLKAQKSSSKIGLGSFLVGVFAIAVIGSIWKSNLEAYFTAYPAQHTVSSQHASRFGAVIKGFEAFGGLRDDAFILPGPYWVDWRLMAIEAGDIKWRPIIENVAVARTHDGRPGKRLYILHPEDRTSLEQLRQWYPQSTITVAAFPETMGQPLFVTVEVPPGALAVSR